MSEDHLIRLFLPLGWDLSPGPVTRDPLSLRAFCRQHSKGLDVYPCTSGFTCSPAVRLTATEFAACISWLPAAPDATGATTRAPSSTRPPPDPHENIYHAASGVDVSATLSVDASSSPCASSTFSLVSGGKPLLSLLGLERVLWRGRWSTVPASCRAAHPSCPPTLQLQVFLYDMHAWRQVAAAEAGCESRTSAAAPTSGAQVTGSASGPPLPPPLPLRLALRPVGHPGLRDPNWDPKPTADSSTAGLAAAAAEAKTAAAAAAGVSGTTVSPVAEASSWPFWLQGLATRSGACILEHSATGRHVHHMAACVALLYDLYGDRVSQVCRWMCLRRDTPAGARTGAAAPGPCAHRAVSAPRSARGDSTELPTSPSEGAAASRRRKGAASGGRVWQSPAAGDAAGKGVGVQRGAPGAGRRVRLKPGGGSGGGDSGGGGGEQFHSGDRGNGLAAGGSAPHRFGRQQVPDKAPVAHSRVRGRATVGVVCLLLSLALQLLAGPAVAMAVWRRRGLLTAAAEAVAAGGERLLRQQYDWLMTATPAGVKLHAELCALLGTAAHGILRGAGAAARWGWPSCSGAAVGLLAAGSALGGGVGGLALLHDLLLLGCLPLALQAGLTAQLMRRHVAWLATAWALMRGKQRSTRRRHHTPAPPPPPAPDPPQPHPPAAAGAMPAAAIPGGLVLPTAGGSTEIDAPKTEPGPGSGSGSAGGARPRLASLRGFTLRRRGAPTDCQPMPRAHEEPHGQRQGCGQSRVEVEGPLLPISRLESLLGLAPDPGSDAEVAVEPLIVGVLLLVPLLALLPTTAAWRLLALAAWGVPAAVRAALALAAGALGDNVVLALAWRCWRPLSFPGPEIMVYCATATPMATRGVEAVGETMQPSRKTCGPGVGSPRGPGLGGGIGVLAFVVEPLPLPCWRVARTWLVRGLRGGWETGWESGCGVRVRGEGLLRRVRERVSSGGHTGHAAARLWWWAWWLVGGDTESTW